MVMRRHALLTSCLKQACSRPAFTATHLRRYATNSAHNADIAILGGGITGLATAYYISKEVPSAKITIYEAGPRVGGWLHSKRVEVDGGTVLFEQGPRTLRFVRPNGLLTALLVRVYFSLPEELFADLMDSIRFKTWA